MNLSLVQPELWLTVLAFVVLGIDLLVGRSARGFVAWVAGFGLLGITAFSGGLLVTGSFAGGLYKADLYTSLFRVLIPLTSAFVGLLSMQYVSRRLKYAGEYYGLLVIATLAMVLTP